MEPRRLVSEAGNSLIHGFQIETNPAAEDGKPITVHTDVGDQRITQQQYDRILLNSHDTDSFRINLFNEVLRAQQEVANSRGGPTTRIGVENPAPGTVEQRDNGPANTGLVNPGQITQPTVGPGGLPNDPAEQSGIEVLPKSGGEVADDGGPLVNDQANPGSGTEGAPV